MGPKKDKAGATKAVATASKTKKGKDPNAPKRPPSAYLLFSNANRAKVQKEVPQAKLVMKKLAEMWTELQDKSEWNDKANEAKAAYEDAMKDYDGGEKNVTKAKENGKAKKRTSDDKKEKTAKKRKVEPVESSPEKSSDVSEEQSASDSE